MKGSFVSEEGSTMARMIARNHIRGSRRPPELDHRGSKLVYVGTPPETPRRSCEGFSLLWGSSHEMLGGAFKFASAPLAVVDERRGLPWGSLRHQC